MLDRGAGRGLGVATREPEGAGALFEAFLELIDARRGKILDGAARCCARDGFQGTLMQDTLSEVGLSAGAVHRCFGGTGDLIAVIAGEVVGGVREAFGRAAQLGPLAHSRRADRPREAHPVR
ncbi:TetR/AcrR family transcriptional regulator [Streptomyces brevispora]|uniref:TetR/AcrR family transcriptional regulator n=1 Tax=Streptomyces brevispora TaxID=887462 RepID=UPI003810B6EF